MILSPSPSHTHTRARHTNTHSHTLSSARTISVFASLITYSPNKICLHVLYPFFCIFFCSSFRCETCQIVALLLRIVSDSLTLLTVILLAKGWTVVRRKISAKGRVKIAIFMTSCVLSHIFLLIDIGLFLCFSSHKIFCILFIFCQVHTRQSVQC